NPYGHETTFFYDSWDRLIKVIDYLGNEVTTSYVETNNSYTVTTQGDDGSSSVTVYDPLKRVTEVRSKDVLGQWTKVSYQYDKFDRIWKQSEPYSGSSASQWNETTYDLYGRPISQILFTGKAFDIAYNGLSTTVDDGVKMVTSVKD